MENESSKSLPWLDDEMIRVDGYKLCYSVKDDEITVHLPGCLSVRLNSLRLMGHRISMPVRIRTKTFA
jgi:hypothetical protein